MLRMQVTCVVVTAGHLDFQGGIKVSKRYYAQLGVPMCHKMYLTLFPDLMSS